MLSKAQIKYIHSLRHKKYRLKSGSFLAEGIKVTDELLTEKYIPVVEIFALALALPRVDAVVKGLTVRRVIYRPGKVLNLVAN